MGKRGLSEDAIRKFQIGYVPLGVNHQLAGRIITPISSATGELVAVSTRHLFKEKKKSFWHEDYDKSFYLYGLDVARKNILRRKMAIVVEGEFDTVALHSYGVDFAVGLCGSAFGKIHLSLLARYCKTIYMCFDNDKGGKSAFNRTRQLFSDNCLEGIVSLIPVRMPEGKDPDEFIRERGKRQLADLMKASKDQFNDMGFI